MSTIKVFIHFILLFFVGGTTMFPGFPTRLENELVKLYREEISSNSEKVNIEVKVRMLPIL